MTEIMQTPNLLAAGQVAKQNKEQQARAVIENFGRQDKPLNAKQALKAAQEFESVFLGVMLAPMFSGESMKNSLTNSHAEQTYRGLLTEQYADTITKAGGIGIADHIYRELMTLQEIK